MQSRITTTLSLSFLLFALAPVQQVCAARVKPQPVPPDFTRGERVLGKNNTWSLGPTGAHGEIWAAKNAFHTEGATQIYITKVAPDTPAAGVLAEGDVILGVASPVTTGKKSEHDGLFDLDALGLLATGNKRYWPMIKACAHRMAPADLALDINQTMVSWNWAYTALFLAEYYLATNDAFVLPALTEYATKIAMGQSGAGTWGHSMAMPAKNDGKLHGPACGYGSMNQIGLTCTLALVMAQKCGIDLSLKILNEDRWGRYGRKMQVIPALKPYGGALKDHLPELKTLAGNLVDINKGIQAAFEAIETEEAPSLISIADFIEEPVPEKTSAPARK